MPTALSVDRLSGLFLVISFAVAVPVSSVCAASAVRPGRVRYRSLAATHCLALGSVAVIITADNAFVFLLGWELLTIAFYLLAGLRPVHDRARPTRRIITVVFGKVSGAALLVGALLLAARAGALHLCRLRAAPRSGLRGGRLRTAGGGFAVKIGLVPVHIWMPRGYASRARAGCAR